MTTLEKILAGIETFYGNRSAWDRGVNAYAAELLENLDEAIRGGYFDAINIADKQKLASQLLNGARDWKQYSWGGCSLAYDGFIAQRLCTPSELKKTRNGERRPNSREEWLDVQARALRQAASRIVYIASHIEKTNV